MDERINANVSIQCPHSAERVFDCWLHTDSIRLWMSAALKAMGLPGQLSVIEVDGRVGGKFRFADERGATEACHWGTYRVVDRPTQLAFTWNASDKFADLDEATSLVTLNFLPTKAGCQIKLVHSMDPQWINYLKRTEKGWENMLIHICQFLNQPAS